MTNEQKYQEFLEIGHSSLDELRDKTIVLRDELEEQGEELPDLLISKGDSIHQYLKGYSKDKQGNIILDLNEVIDVCEFGLGIKVGIEGLEQPIISFKKLDRQGMYRLIYNSAGEIVKKNLIYTLGQILIEKSYRRRLLQRVLRKLLTEDEATKPVGGKEDGKE